MLKIKDASLVKTWIYQDPETGHIISHFGDVPAITNRVKVYRKANALPIPSSWSEQLEAILCQHLPEACADSVPPTLVQKAASVTRSLYYWARQGFPTRSESEVVAITEICKSCPEYGGETGMFKVICRKCGCSRKKIALKTENCPIGKW